LLQTEKIKSLILKPKNILLCGKHIQQFESHRSDWCYDCLHLTAVPERWRERARVGGRRTVHRRVSRPDERWMMRDGCQCVESDEKWNNNENNKSEGETTGFTMYLFQKHGQV
jgi:hypothetical protein